MISLTKRIENGFMHAIATGSGLQSTLNFCRTLEDDEKLFPACVVSAQQQDEEVYEAGCFAFNLTVELHSNPTRTTESAHDGWARSISNYLFYHDLKTEVPIYELNATPTTSSTLYIYGVEVQSGGRQPSQGLFTDEFRLTVHAVEIEGLDTGSISPPTGSSWVLNNCLTSSFCSGTASFALSASAARTALTASLVLGTVASASVAGWSLSSSVADSATTAGTSSLCTGTSSWSLNSAACAGTASHALTASLALQSAGTIESASVAEYAATASVALWSLDGDYATEAGDAARAYTSSVCDGTSSYALISDVANSATTANTSSVCTGTSSWALTASVSLNGGGGSVSENLKYRKANFTLFGDGAALTTGSYGYLEIPCSGSITGWTLVSSITGGIIEVDVFNSSYSGFPTSESIAGTERPLLSGSDQKSQNLSLSTWTASVLPGDILSFQVTTASVRTGFSLTLNITAT